MRYLLTVVAFLLVAGALPAAAAETSAAKIQRALSAGPPSIQAGATVVDADMTTGKMTVLRKGTNGWTCVAGHPGVVGDDPLCADAQSLIWMNDWSAHKSKPTNTKPGIVYMLAGGSDWSATDPFATKGTPIHEPPHWMIMWPYDPATSGLSAKNSDTGTWIMYAGTPWAHLMINQKP